MTFHSSAVYNVYAHAYPNVTVAALRAHAPYNRSAIIILCLISSASENYRSSGLRS